VVNADSPIDLVALALQLGATYVARGFSGDKQQLVPLIKGAIAHRGAAFLDVISPCVAFNNHDGSTKSYAYVREHNDAVNRLDVIPTRSEITVDYAAGETIEVEQHSGARLRLHKLNAEHDPRDCIAAMNYVQAHQARGEVVTGLLFVDPEAGDLHEHLKTTETALNSLAPEQLCPGAAMLDRINARLR
jgi:2-oxoglutarate ferredoxin oxidoreductase subunit beta